MLLIRFSSSFCDDVGNEFEDTANVVPEVRESGVDIFKRFSLLLAIVSSRELLLHPSLFVLRDLSLVTELTILSPPFTRPPPFRASKGEWDRPSLNFWPL